MNVVEMCREAVRTPLETDGDIYWAAEYGRPIPADCIDRLVIAVIDTLAANVTPGMMLAGKEVPCDDEASGGVIYSSATEARAIFLAMLAAAKEQTR